MNFLAARGFYLQGEASTGCSGMFGELASKTRRLSEAWISLQALHSLCMPVCVCVCVCALPLPLMFWVSQPKSERGYSEAVQQC